MRQIALTVGLAALVAFSGPMQAAKSAEREPMSDEWGTSGRFPANIEECEITPDPLVHPVDREMRDQSISRLDETSAVELNDAEAASLIGLTHESALASASSLVAAQLEALGEQKHNAVVERRGSWSAADELEYSALSAGYAAGDYESYRPYLVRAVAKSEGSGHFYATRCGGDLFIYHGSLGRTVPPSTKAPLVVFLPAPPHRVFVIWGMAE